MVTTKVSKRVGLLVAACLLSAALWAARWSSRIPSYGGQPLSFWLNQLPIVSVEGPSGSTLSRVNVVYSNPFFGGASGAGTSRAEDHRKALTAIRAIGTNGFAFLIQKLEQRPPRSRFSKLAQRYAANLSLTQKFFPSAQQVEKERRQAVTGLLALCPLPPDAVERLRALSLDFQGPAWSLAGDVLRANENPRVLRDALKENK
jgi:hypothetical protein